MTVYFLYYWYKFVDLLKDLQRKILIKANHIAYERHIKRCHKYIKRDYLSMLKKLDNKQWLSLLDTHGKIIIANNGAIKTTVKKHRTGGKWLVIDEDIYNLVKENWIDPHKNIPEIEWEVDGNNKLTITEKQTT